MLWMISKVRRRSWLPVVVKKRNDSLPPWAQKMAELPALGVSGLRAALPLQDADDLALAEDPLPEVRLVGALLERLEDEVV
jgi:hypothetical protein